MYKLDIDWSPSKHLGHDKLALDIAKLAGAQQRASRAAVRMEWSRGREEILANISANETRGVENEDVDSKTHDQQTGTEHTGDLPVDIFEEDLFLKDDKVKCCYNITREYQMENCYQLSVFQLVVSYPGTSHKLEFLCHDSHEAAFES